MSDTPTSAAELKRKTGLARVVDATRYSLAGLAAAWRHEDAFRQEVMLASVMIPVALFLPLTGLEKALLVASVLMVLVVELLNSGIEAVVDRVSLDHHHLAKRAKDVGSAAVMLSLITTALVWGLVLLG